MFTLLARITSLAHSIHLYVYRNYAAFSDRPHPTRPHSDRPHPTRPHSDRPHPTRPHSDRPSRLTEQPAPVDKIRLGQQAVVRLRTSPSWLHVVADGLPCPNWRACTAL